MYALLTQLVECLLDVEKVSGSSPLQRTRQKRDEPVRSSFFVLRCAVTDWRPLSQSERDAQVHACVNLTSTHLLSVKTYGGQRKNIWNAYASAVHKFIEVLFA